MKAPLSVRPVTEGERARLEAALRSPDAFTLRRAQVLLASARGQAVGPIALALGCSAQTVRNAIRAFNSAGPDCLGRRSNRPKSAAPVFGSAQGERLRALLHQSPRSFGKPSSLWTLALAAQVCQEQGLTAQQVSDETVRRALLRLGVGWKRAKHWINSPDPAYARKKSGATP
jgi:transposase